MTTVADNWPTDAEAADILGGGTLDADLAAFPNDFDFTSEGVVEAPDYNEWYFGQVTAPTLAQIVAPYGPQNFKGALVNTVALGPLEIAQHYVQRDGYFLSVEGVDTV